MISIVSSMHKRDVSLWLTSLSYQTASIEVVLVVYDDFSPPIGMQSDNGIEDYPLDIKIIQVDKVDGPYPEAWLKNIGIKAASHDVVCCTNIDIVYTEDFFAQVENSCKEDTLVQATRFDTPEGTETRITGGNIVMDMPKGSSMNIVVDPSHDFLALSRAVGDCQAMRKEDWEELTGYNESFVGWGGLDTDLECRAILAGKNIFTIGFAANQDSGKRVSHYHIWHQRDINRIIKEGFANKERLVDGLNGREIQANSKWGEHGCVPV